jgi:pimeloyl-ACP methyl ester carboxylesterase
MTLGLVHGASHGGWCWESLLPEIQRVGLAGVAMDTPVEDVGAGLAEHADAVAVALDGVSGPIVVVGHSAGGAFLPLAAARSGADAMIFLCAMVPVEGESCADQRAREPGMVTMPTHQLQRDELGRTKASPDVARQYYYDDCAPEIAERAIPRLRRQAPTVMAERFPVGGWPDIPSHSILCTDDRAVSPDWSRRVSRERLGRAALELPGGHSPFYSRPTALAVALAAAVKELLA